MQLLEMNKILLLFSFLLSNFLSKEEWERFVKFIRKFFALLLLVFFSNNLLRFLNFFESN